MSDRINNLSPQGDRYYREPLFLGDRDVLDFDGAIADQLYILLYCDAIAV